MPELPELEFVVEVLTRRVLRRPIERISIAPRGGPLVLRDLTGRGFSESLTGCSFEQISRRGKYLLFATQPAGRFLVINPKLSGRLQLAAPQESKAGPQQVVFTFTDPPEELRYLDRKRMGQLYLTDDLGQIPMFAEMGPKALVITRQAFHDRLRQFRGEIKGILAREQFIAGIGNAYADEILWQAGIYPYCKRPQLSTDQVDDLYDALHHVLEGAIVEVRKLMGENIHLKPRDFFAVHMKGGQPCPRCGSTVSSITANQRITNFCRTCQPGSLIGGI